MPTWFVPGVAALYGLVFGSFLNVVIHRLPREISLVRPRSHCPGCGALVQWYDNIPVLSFVLLRGRCRHCQLPISLRYPAVEVLTAALTVAVVSRFGLTRVGAVALLLVLLLIALALIDLEHHLLPDLLTLPGLVIGLAVSIIGVMVPLEAALAGAAVGAAIPYAVIVLYRAIRGVEGMGLGDVKLLAMIGAFLGWRGTLLTLVVGACAGAAVGVGMIAVGKGRSDTELPFGTFLAGAAVLVLFFGTRLGVLFGWWAP